MCDEEDEDFDDRDAGEVREDEEYEDADRKIDAAKLGDIDLDVDWFPPKGRSGMRKRGD